VAKGGLNLIFPWLPLSPTVVLDVYHEMNTLRKCIGRTTTIVQCILRIFESLDSVFNDFIIYLVPKIKHVGTKV
jgi:hypothetical protein